MGKLLIVVDMQNDFIDGELPAEGGKEIVQSVADYIRNFDGYGIVVTMDTHFDNTYPLTAEGATLPLHCEYDTYGWRLNDTIYDVIADVSGQMFVKTFQKQQFSSIELANWIYTGCVPLGDIDEIEICGLCTDICVMSNAIIISQYTEFPVTVLSNLCAGTTKEAHTAALNVMKNCLISVKEV